MTARRPALGRMFAVERPADVDMRRSQQPVYDREIELGLLYEDPTTGAEHYVVRYPVGLQAKAHRHSAAHTIVVLEGRMIVNDQEIGPGAYAHWPAGETMFHGPVDGSACLFIIMFHGPFDVEVVV